jgi:hypothetical protein
MPGLAPGIHGVLSQRRSLLKPGVFRILLSSWWRVNGTLLAHLVGPGHAAGLALKYHSRISAPVQCRTPA